MDEYIFDLRQLFLQMNENDKDIDAAEEYAHNLLKLGLPVIFDKNHLAALLGCSMDELAAMMVGLEEHYYHEVKIPKKNGGLRILKVPAFRLKVIQRWILDNILKKMHVSECANGFCKKKSIVTNASVHIGKKCLINMDLKDFFPSIKQNKIFLIFYYYGYTTEVSYLLSRLCTCSGELPQGAPTSPYLSNIACLKLDKRLSGLAEKYKADYSRYADDISISADTDISNMVDIVKRIVKEENFLVNDKKTRVSFNYQKQEVTGLIVNGNQVRIEKKYLKKLKQEIYYCKKYGVEDHLKHINCDKRFYREHIYGKAYFVNMVDKKLGKKILSELDGINWEWDAFRKATANE